MAAGEPLELEDDRCATALDAVLEVAIEECLPRERLVSNLARKNGVEPDVDCEAALEEGLDEATLRSPNGVRQWVTCRTAEIVDDEDVSLSDAMEQAWDEAKTAGANQGIDV